VLFRHFGAVFRSARTDGARIVTEPERPHGFGQSAPQTSRASGRNLFPFFLLALLLSGCGGVALKTGNTVMATPSTVAFGNVTVGQTGSVSVTLQNRGISAVQVEDLGSSNQAFSLADGTTFPISLAVGASTTVQVRFSPTSSGSQTEPLMITSSLSANPASLANMTGTGTPGVSAVTCSSNFLVAGSGTDNCTVTINATALAGGFPISLASNNAALALPGTVTIPANATSASFAATATTVNAIQTALLTATGSGTSQSFALSLAPAGTRLVQLNWNAPNSPSDTIVGYNVYRAMNGATYELLNGTLNASTSYTDGAVQSGSAYNYYVESIDAAGDSSGPSNLTSVAVP
jgi:hypothetical protein